MLDNPEVGGLGLSTMQVGTIYGVVGLIALTIGGILGGIFMARKGLKHWLWSMTAAMNLPNLVYVYLAFAHPSNIWLISSAVAIEQFGYGFGLDVYKRQVHPFVNFKITGNIPLSANFIKQPFT